MSYNCVAFGWFHELLREERVATLVEAETRVAEMLGENAMIVHAYRDTDGENPELVGKHARLCNFTGGHQASTSTPAGHEICRFLRENQSVEAWRAAKERDVLMDSRWLVVDLYTSGSGTTAEVYGRAMLQRSANAG